MSEWVDKMQCIICGNTNQLTICSHVTSNIITFRKLRITSHCGIWHFILVKMYVGEVDPFA